MNRLLTIPFAVLLNSNLTPAADAQEAQAPFVITEQTIPGSSVSFRMVPIPGGTFFMGSPATEKGRRADEGPVIRVQLDSFWMEEHEVTYEEYILFQDEALDKGPLPDGITRPSPPYIDFTLGMGKTGGFPANSMSQYAAIMYCKWLYKKTKIFYRLPTEAEWEYACRAGTANLYPFGDAQGQGKDTGRATGMPAGKDAGRRANAPAGNDDEQAQLNRYAWWKGNSEEKYHAVKQLAPNAWGLYDMLGNVAEWTLDQYQEDYYTRIAGNPVNPMWPPVTKYPVTLRGGSYRDEAPALRCAIRVPSERKWNARDPQIPRSQWWNTDAPFIGFRIVRPLRQPDPAAAEQFFSQFLSDK
ncbi:MAG TPA: SUMF1/EgtB/PvdO family nonheme iron enzyme [Puia sp.]|nr:SUMF1/EgtB/PvdO family nonheme iron enzyme [Puia sp.]